MNSLQLDSLAIEKMASSHESLSLSERISWEDFPRFAEDLISLFGGEIIEKIDGPDIRLWQVKYRASTLRLVFDDYPLMVSLESLDSNGDLIIHDLYKILLPLKIS